MRTVVLTMTVPSHAMIQVWCVKTLGIVGSVRTVAVRGIVGNVTLLVPLEGVVMGSVSVMLKWIVRSVRLVGGNITAVHVMNAAL